jgi:serine/threonine protein kinase
VNEHRRYRILNVLGRGGFGTVYRAELQGSEGFVKEVAVKVLNPVVEASPQHLARLRDEARMLGLVRHRALVGVDGLVKLLDRWAVVMEYVDGVSLSQLLQGLSSGRFPVPIALQIVEEVASGLHAAYTSSDREGRPLRLLHRDVKPSNVQLTRHGEVKLLDFGIARAEFAEREAATASRMVIGSVPYLAPERLGLEDSHAADVYSLGVTLVQLVSGALPKTATGEPRRHEARVEEACALVAQAGGAAELTGLVRRCLAWAAAERPDARELERACRSLHAGGGLHLRDWAEAVVTRHQAAHAVEQGEFTGMLLGEATTTERHRHLSEMLGSAIPTTFDDLTTSETIPPPPEPVSSRSGPPPPPPPPVRAAPPARAAPPVQAAAPAAQAAALAPWPPPGPRSQGAPGRSLVTLAIGGLLATAALVVVGTVVAVLTMAAGGSALVGLVVVALMSDPEGACRTSIQTARAELSAADVRGIRRANSLFDRAETACRDGRLGLWTANVLTSRVRQLAEDGRLTDDDLFSLEQELVRLTAP